MYFDTNIPCEWSQANNTALYKNNIYTHLRVLVPAVEGDVAEVLAELQVQPLPAVERLGLRNIEGGIMLCTVSIRKKGE